MISSSTIAANLTSARARERGANLNTVLRWGWRSCSGPESSSGSAAVGEVEAALSGGWAGTRARGLRGPADRRWSLQYRYGPAAPWRPDTVPARVSARAVQRWRGLSDEMAADQEITVPAAPLNVALTAALKLESLWLRVIDNAFGSSLLCLARKPG